MQKLEVDFRTEFFPPCKAVLPTGVQKKKEKNAFKIAKTCVHIKCITKENVTFKLKYEVEASIHDV